MAGGNDLPDEVQHFLREYISSVEQLEILLHLHRNPSIALTSQELAQALYISPESIAVRLEAFQANKVLVSEEVQTGNKIEIRYALNKLNGSMMQRLAELDRLYRERRVSVINFIFSNPIATIQSFADAFILGKKKE
jgi:hypothetical protein